MDHYIVIESFPAYQHFVVHTFEASNSSQVIWEMLKIEKRYLELSNDLLEAGKFVTVFKDEEEIIMHDELKNQVIISCYGQVRSGFIDIWNYMKR